MFTAQSGPGSLEEIHELDMRFFLACSPFAVVNISGWRCVCVCVCVCVSVVCVCVGVCECVCVCVCVYVNMYLCAGSSGGRVCNSNHSSRTRDEWHGFVTSGLSCQTKYLKKSRARALSRARSLSHPFSPCEIWTPYLSFRFMCVYVCVCVL